MQCSPSACVGDVFIAVTPEKTYIWKGEASTNEEQAAAAFASGHLLQGATPREKVHVAEGSEGDDFWAVIGGEGAHLEYGLVVKCRLDHFLVLMEGVGNRQRQ